MRARGIHLWLALAAVTSLLLLPGCSENEVSAPDNDEPAGQIANLDDEFGGYLPTDEAPAFGDPELAAAGSGEQPVANGYEGLSAEQQDRARSLERDSHAANYCFTAVWGNLEGARDSDSATPGQSDEVIWDGSLQMTEGAVRVLGLLFFEPGQGDLVLPRTQPELVQWQSRTCGDTDGLRFMLVVPGDSSRVAPSATVTFIAGTYERVFAEEELDSLNETITVSETESICFRSFRVEPAADVRGFVDGDWCWAADNALGSFAGLWVGGLDGQALGWIRGIYGVDSNDEQVFFGKYIDQIGHFRGFVRGHYNLTASGLPGTSQYRERGEFWGDWVARDGAALGRIEGTWGQRGDGRGRFHGIWRGTQLTP